MHSKLILLVEDSTSQAKALKAILEQKGFAVIVVGSFGAMQNLMESEDPPELFLAICDLNLPDASEGEAVGWLSDHNVETIVYTAHVSKQLQDSIVERSVIDYVLKKDANSLVLLAEQCETLWHNTQLKILVVDDAPSTLQLMQHLMLSQKFEVATAATAAEAREKAKEFAPDLMIIDLILPDGDGASLTRQIRNDHHDHDMLIIGVSVKSEFQSTIDFIKQGANDFIAKPFTPEEFICRVNQLANNVYKQKQLMGRLDRHDLMNKMLSHDIRSPVSGMVSMANILLRTLDLSEDQKEMVESISSAGQDVMSLLEDALNLHQLDHIDQLEQEQINLAELVAGIIEEERPKTERKNIAIESLVDRNLVALSNRRLFRQCLRNLVDNAIKYSEFNCKVIIRGRVEHNYIILEVEDQGLGISEADAQKLFQPFSKISNKPTGGETSTGLGLSVVKRIINLLSGEISYAPGPAGKGSCFSLEIPQAFN